MFIELHILQNFSPSNLNRDDTNNPKDCTFGGVRRARISSQCIKRAVRLHPAFADTTGVPLAQRTIYLARALAKNLVDANKTEEDAQAAAGKFVSALLGGLDSKQEARSKVLFFVSEVEKKTMVDMILKNWDEVLSRKIEQKSPMIGEFTKQFKNRTSAPDIAMFGRMLAKDPKLNMDAACQVAHALSTHRVSMEFDFFTAVDDLQESDKTGAEFLGILGYNAATFYRYARVDFKQLVKNLGDYDLAIKTVEGFLRASALAVPTGKQNSFAAQNPPAFMMAVTRNDGMSWSLANAFEKPVYPSGNQSLLEASIDALDKYWNALVQFYGDGPKPVVGTVGDPTGLTTLETFKAHDFESWISTVLAALPRG